MSERLKEQHIARKAILYVRQSSQHQVLHNAESRKLQYGMEHRLRDLGWRDVEVIDEDLGRSGTTTEGRTGFQRMVAEVCLGKVGAVAAREVSRFARNNKDWHQLLEMCALVDTLLVDHESLYDPRRANDRLLLGLKGSLSEYEIDLLLQRSVEARWAKARRGELVILAPVGFMKTPDQRLEKDPNLRVRHAIELVFEKFFEFGSARQAFMWFIDHGLELPAKRHGPGGWETWWRRPTHRTICSIVREPTYAGAYAYGRTEKRTQVIDGVARSTRVRKPLDKWGVLLRDRHEGYISWEQFERVQEMLSHNSSQFHAAGATGAPKKGVALLSGLLRCRRCARKLMVDYSGKNATIPRYCCRRGRLDSGEPTCIGLGGLLVDEAISREILRLVSPCAIEASTLAVTEEAGRRAAVADALRLELTAAEYRAERAWRQYDAVDPTNRLVADELERRWNLALTAAREAEVRLEEAVAQQRASLPEIEQLTGLDEQLREAWDADETDVRLKKRILRTLIREIVIDIDDDASEADLLVHWKGGVHTNLRVAHRRRGQSGSHTSSTVVDAVSVLARVSTDKAIAGFLNRNGLLTGRGNRWTQQRVTSLRSHRKIPRYTEDGQREGGWLNLTDAAAYVAVSSKTLRSAVDRGVLSALHPLADGPWVFAVTDLDRTRNRVKRGRNDPAGPHAEQLILEISDTWPGEAL